jgi:hypothetical protein
MVAPSSQAFSGREHYALVDHSARLVPVPDVGAGTGNHQPEQQRQPGACGLQQAARLGSAGEKGPSSGAGSPGEPLPSPPKSPKVRSQGNPRRLFPRPEAGASEWVTGGAMDMDAPSLS